MIGPSVTVLYGIQGVPAKSAQLHRVNIPMIKFELINNFCVARLLRFNFEVTAGFESLFSSMTSQESRRSACFESFRAGRTAKETADFFCYPLRTVYDLEKRFDEEIAAG